MTTPGWSSNLKRTYGCLFIPHPHAPAVRRPPALVRGLVAACVAGASLALSPSALALSQEIFASVNGQSTDLGSLDSAVNSRVEEGMFQLNAASQYLMNDAKSWQFRYFQIVVNDPDPINYLGQPLNSPYTDPPSNGWDYQRTPAGNWQAGTPGADTSPFYENDDNAGATYAFPKYSGQLAVFGGQAGPFPVHSQANGYALTQDVPGYGTSALQNTSLLFDTFITFYSPDLAANKDFIVLGGYAWGVGRDGSGNYYDIAPTALDLSQTETVQLNASQALQADGFTGWTPLFGGDITVPEPGSAALLALGALVLVLRKRPAPDL